MVITEPVLLRYARRRDYWMNQARKARLLHHPQDVRHCVRAARFNNWRLVRARRG